MALDFHKLVNQIDSMVSKFNCRNVFFDKALASAIAAINEASPLVLEKKRLLSRTSFLSAGFRDSISGRYSCPTMPANYTVLAVDGSSIDIDRHFSARCYLINIGRVSIGYGETPYAILNNEPVLYSTDESMYFVDPLNNRTQNLEGNLLGSLRSMEELKALVEICKESDPDIPVLALIDGSMILWGIVNQAYPDFVRQKLIDDMFLPLMDELKHMSANRPIAVASYLSMPRSMDVINSLRLHQTNCHYTVANCDVHCGSLIPGSRPCDGLIGVTDRDLFGSILDETQRSDHFASTSSIVERHYESHKIHFYYLNVGPEIVRVEIPEWVATNEELINITHSILVSQSRKGHGYPVALTEAHEKAVITASDRETFRLLVENVLEGHDLPVFTSRKNLSKKLKWL